MKKSNKNASGSTSSNFILFSIELVREQNYIKE